MSPRYSKLPVLLVVANRLGCLNHTLLTIESIRAHDQECRGLILNSLPGIPTSPPDKQASAGGDLRRPDSLRYRDRPAKN